MIGLQAPRPRRIVALLLPLIVAAAANAQFMTGRPADANGPAANSADAQAIQAQVGFDQNLGAQLPLDTSFVDSTGKSVRLADLVHDKPILLDLVYYRCPVLCSLAERGLARALKPLSLEPGREFDVVFLSFDPTDTPETAAVKRAETLKAYGKAETAPGWHFLSGDEASIRKVTEAVGFRYMLDPVTHQYAHATGVVVVTPDGKLSRYLYGVDPEPRDLQLALSESSAGKIGGPVTQLLLVCFRYNAALGKYTASTMIILRIAAGATLAALVVFILAAVRRDRRSPAGGVA